MNQPYLYDPQANVLRQRADRQPPKFGAFFDSSDYEEADQERSEYDAYLASLPAYTPVSGWVPEVGKEYVAGVHFQVMDTDKWWWAKCEKCGWEGSSEHLHTEKNMGEATDDAYCACPNCYSVNVEGISKYSVADMSGKFAAPLPFIEVAVPIEQKQERPLCHECDGDGYVTNGEHPSSEDYRDYTCEACMGCGRVKEKEEPRVFSLADMIECWEAAVEYGDANCETGGETRLPNKQQYFKSKGIDLP